MTDDLTNVIADITDVIGADVKTAPVEESVEPTGESGGVDDSSSSSESSDDEEVDDGNETVATNR